MKTAVCCIIKQENLYLRDFVEYYKRIGFDNIILWDNNDENGEYPHQVIGDYISDGFVIYENCRGMYRYQLEAYTISQKKYKNDFDWIAYFDCDEFIEFTDVDNIKTFLGNENFNKCDGILVYWRQYGDSGKVHYENKPVYERFKEFHTPKEGEKCNFKLILKTDDSHIFDIVFRDANQTSYYYNEYDAVFYNCNGKENMGNWLDWTFDGAYLNHYGTLTIEEFLYRRFCRRSYADRNSNFNKDSIMPIFYDYNKITPEKQQIIDDFFDKFKFEDDNYVK